MQECCIFNNYFDEVVVVVCIVEFGIFVELYGNVDNVVVFVFFGCNFFWGFSGFKFICNFLVFSFDIFKFKGNDG